MNTSALLKDLHSAHVTDVAWRDDMIRDLREALKFYADKKNYNGFDTGVLVDNGKIARAALEKR